MLKCFIDLVDICFKFFRVNLEGILDLMLEVIENYCFLIVLNLFFGGIMFDGFLRLIYM